MNVKRQADHYSGWLYETSRAVTSHLATDNCPSSPRRESGRDLKENRHRHPSVIPFAHRTVHSRMMISDANAASEILDRSNRAISEQRAATSLLPVLSTFLINIAPLIVRRSMGTRGRHNARVAVSD